MIVLLSVLFRLFLTSIPPIEKAKYFFFKPDTVKKKIYQMLIKKRSKFRQMLKNIPL